MNRDDEDSALAQQQLEQRRQEEEMLGCAEYLKWLTKLYEKVTHEIPGESLR